MFMRALSERAGLRGLVGVRTLYVYLDLPLDASLFGIRAWFRVCGQCITCANLASMSIEDNVFV